MATTVTSDNFDDYLAQGLQRYGIVEEVADIESLEEIDADDLEEGADFYTLPMTKGQGATTRYAKMPISDYTEQGQTKKGLMSAVASMVATEGMMQAITDDEFAEIFD